MRTRLLIKTLLMAVALAPLTANAQLTLQGKTATVKRDIEEVWRRVIEADKKGDAAAAAAVYANDAMIVDPSAPTVTGKANIEKFYKTFSRRQRFSRSLAHRAASRLRATSRSRMGRTLSEFRKTASRRQNLVRAIRSCSRT